MKIYLACYFEPKNHGPGNLYAIANTKPDNLKIAGAFKYFIPSEKLMNDYKNKQLENQISASVFFKESYKEHLDNFVKKVMISAKEENKSPQELLPFSDGDTLVCWEREGYTSYRGIVSECLISLGYDVVLR